MRLGGGRAVARHGPGRAARRGVVALLAAAVGACASPGPAVPDREPDVVGVVVRGADGAAVLGQPSDPYFEGMSLLRGDPLVVRGSDGAPISHARLVVGADVEVWIDGACAESFPVQCGVEAVRMRD